MRAKIRAFLEGFINVVDGFFAYIMTLAAVVISPLMPAIKSGRAVQFSDLHLSWFSIILAAVFAIVVTGISEMRGAQTDNPEVKAAAKQAKKKNFFIRMAVAFSIGLGWGNLI